MSNTNPIQLLYTNKNILAHFSKKQESLQDTCLISAHFSNRNKKDHYRYSKLAYNRNKKAYKTSRLFDFGALLQQKQETPLPINTKGWRPPCGQIDYTDRNIWRTSPTKKDSHPLSGNHYRFDLESQSNGYHYQYIGGLIQQKIIQESFTRNDIFNSREIHFNTVLQRAPRHHHSNIHTSITYTQSYAIKKMPKKKIKDSKFKAWDSNNEVGAFLYVLFQEGVINPNSYSPVTIYDHPLLNPIFRPYDRRNFGTHCKTLQKREAKHSQYGNVLDPDFKALVKLEKVRRKDLLQQLLNPDGIDNSEDDESYVNKSEDDLSFDADTEEASLSALLRNQTLDIHRPQDINNDKATKKTTTKKSSRPQPRNRKFCLFLSFCVAFISVYLSDVCFFSRLFFPIALQSSSSTETPRIFHPCQRCYHGKL